MGFVHVLVEVGANREPPEHPAGIHEARDLRDAARRAVGTDDHVGAQPCRRQREALELSVVVDGRVRAAVDELGAGGDRGALYMSVEDRSLHDDPVPGIGAAGRGGESHPVPGRPDDEHVADSSRAVHVESQVAQHLNASGSDEVAASLLARNAALSTSATRAPPRASTRAAMLPAGPDPTTSTSKR